MLKKINAARVESSTGFVFHVVGPEIIEYTYNGKIIEVDWLYDQTKNIAYIYASDVDELNAEDKEQMISNIKEVVKLLKGNYVVV